MKGREEVGLHLIFYRIRNVRYNRKQKSRGMTCTKGHDLDLDALLLSIC